MLRVVPNNSLSFFSWKIARSHKLLVNFELRRLLCFLLVSNFECFTPGKIDNTNKSTHVAPKVTYLEKHPVSTTDLIQFLFPITSDYFLATIVSEP